MRREEFETLIAEIGRGAELDSEELVDALGYAGNAWYEIQQLTKSLCAGYRALQKDNERKNLKLEIANAMLAAARAENKRLRERISEQADGGEVDADAEGI